MINELLMRIKDLIAKCLSIKGLVFAVTVALLASNVALNWEYVTIATVLIGGREFGKFINSRK